MQNKFTCFRCGYAIFETVLPKNNIPYATHTNISTHIQYYTVWGKYLKKFNEWSAL